MLSRQDKLQALFAGLGGLGRSLSAAGAPRIGTPAPGILGGLGGFQPAFDARRSQLLASQQQKELMALKKMAAQAQLANALRPAKPVKNSFQTVKLGADGKPDPNGTLMRVAVDNQGNILKVIGPAKDAGPISTTNVNVGEKAFDSEAGKSDAAVRSKILSAGDDSTRSLAALKNLGELVTQSGTQTGSLQPLATSVQGIADDLGINLSSTAKRLGINIGSLQNKEEFQRLSNGLARDIATQFKGSLQFKELEFVQRSVSNLGKSEDGNIKAIASMQAAQELASNRSQELLELEDKFGRGKALNKFRRSRKSDVSFLRQRAKQIEEELKTARNANTQNPLSGLSLQELTAQSIQSRDPAEIDKITQELERRLKQQRGR